ncbi:asparaginase [Ignatzschineria rhizosphaerae]|uniref:Asparaginase n=1 Tax=Ignatzschineria rhizosphaerae TaxID=2923279 RepID=A0ABY3XAB1_9GAMM|nr:asparaginase [Ignatzschineria rhizosphaerae]UNM96903.1 asparaginase [Ignatzschineria rhizosphaerae]
MGKRIIALGSLGGTVSMTKGDSEKGVTPKLTAEDLIESLGDVQALKNLEVVTENITQIPSSYIQFENLLKCYDWAKEQVAQGVDGIVLTQGTDTLEESAFFLDLIWDSDIPLILTGAMRSPDQAGADGPSNLLASLIAASSENSSARGALVVMNNWIYEAKWVEKRHTADVNAFTSQVGPVGIIFENSCRYFKTPENRCSFIKPQAITADVFLYQATLGDTPEILNLIAPKADAIVISSFGAGHVSKEAAEAVSIIAETKPVIISSATLAGSTAYNTYGYIGSEIDLQQRNAIMSGWLSPKKSRLLVALALSNKESIDGYFQKYLSTMVF